MRPSARPPKPTSERSATRSSTQRALQPGNVTDGHDYEGRVIDTGARDAWYSLAQAIAEGKCNRAGCDVDDPFQRQ